MSFVFAELCFACATQNVDEFVADAFLNRRSCGPEILTGIEVRRIVIEMFADSGGCCHTKVAVDVDFANSHTCGFAKHIFGNAFCAGHTSAVLFNGFDVFLRNAGRTVQYDGEAGQTFADFFKDVKAQTGSGLELECAVAGADCDCKGVDAREEDVELFKKHVGKDVKIKAAGGIASLDDAEKFLSLGADRLGTSRIVKIAKANENK